MMMTTMIKAATGTEREGAPLSCTVKNVIIVVVVVFFLSNFPRHDGDNRIVPIVAIRFSFCFFFVFYESATQGSSTTELATKSRVPPQQPPAPRPAPPHGVGSGYWPAANTQATATRNKKRKSGKGGVTKFHQKAKQ